MSYSITAFQKDQGKKPGSTAEIVYALKSSETDIAKIDISFAKMYYSMSSLVSYMTLQSRYIIPPDVSMEVKTQNLYAPGVEAYYIAPHLEEDQGVYEFPTNESFSNAKAAQRVTSSLVTSSPPTILISWVNQDPEAPDKLIDGAINWGQDKSGTPYDDNTHFQLDQKIPLPNVVKSQFIQLADTPEIYANTSDISTNKNSIDELSASTTTQINALSASTTTQINDLKARINQLETFLSNFLTTSVNTDTQSNYYFGLQNMPSDTDPSWNDISSSGVWRQLV